MVKRVFSIFFGLSFFVFFSVVFAQTQDTILTISPEFPRPGENVFIKLDSYSLDLLSSTIKWSENGKVTKSGVGAITYTTKAGGPGSSTSVDIEVITPSGQTFSDGIVFWPAEVTLLYESDGYTPPFYNGGAPYVWGARLKFTAIPEIFKDGKRINPKDLIYTWKKNDQIMVGASGYGKNTFYTSEISYTRVNQNISVEVASPTENLAARASLSVEPSTPYVVFYADSPLYGIIFNKVLPDQIKLVDKEITILATPYYFSTTETGEYPSLSTVWRVDNKSVEQYKDKNELTLRKKDDGVGVSNVSVLVKNPERGFQTGGKSVNISVENK